MLISKQTYPYVSVFKLNSGEEFIGRVMSEDETSFKVSKPLSIVQGPKGLQFSPTMALIDPDKEINVPKPVMTGTPTDATTQQYISLVTGIALPEKSSIIV